MKRGILTIAITVVLLPAAALAQARPGPPARPQPSDVSIRGFFDAGATVFNATQSFKAVLGRPAGVVFGGGVEVGLSQRVFVSLAASRFRRTGHRVFAFEGQVFDLNVPTSITVTPLELTAGYRFRRLTPRTPPTPPTPPNPRNPRNPRNRLSFLNRLEPYAGGGIGWHRYSETSADATDEENAAQTFTGYHVLGGVEIPARSWLAVAAEGQWSSVPNALGKNISGISSTYDEHDLGGLTVRIKLVIGR